MATLTSTELYAKERELKEQIITALRTAIGKKRIVFEDSFEDEANNELQAVSSEGVFFNCDNPKKDGDEYPLYELGMLDALYILSIVENNGKTV